MAGMRTIRADEAHVKADIRHNYDTIAPRYDWVLGALEVLGVQVLRRRLLAQARGRVLEVAVGTGRNLRHYPPHCTITALDFSLPMLREAKRRVAAHRCRAALHLMDAERLAVGTDRFDTVVCTLSLCTFPHPLQALREMRRVTRPDGQVLLLEHGFSDRPWLRALQRRRAERQFAWLGCRWDREPHQLAAEAGLRIVEHRRHLFGVIHVLRLAPGKAG